VNVPLAQRAAWLAGITLVAAIAALAINHRDAGSKNKLPASRRRTACGTPFLKTTEGVAHPVLPCGVKLYIRYQGREVLTQVIDKGPNVPGRDFDITKALANRLDLHGAQTIQWRFAR